ncbi:amino acid ABC transporter substrate-binding protein [Sesbania bispinosa]|nr:amino acid ABC transporter substrate-binding protein [Sesbania bispinosa]
MQKGIRAQFGEGEGEPRRWPWRAAVHGGGYTEADEDAGTGKGSLLRVGSGRGARGVVDLVGERRGSAPPRFTAGRTRGVAQPRRRQGQRAPTVVCYSSSSPLRAQRKRGRTTADGNEKAAGLTFAAMVLLDERRQ